MNTLKDYVNFKLTHADKVAEAEGYPLKMENCKKYKKMKQLELYGNSLQDGTPTPDAPVEVVSVGDKSVNLATAQQVCNTFNLYEEITVDGRECIRYNNNGRNTDFPYKENTQYTITFDYKVTQRSSAALEPSTEVLYFFYSDGTKGAVSGGDAVHSSTMDVWLKGKMTSKAGKTVIAIGVPGNFYKNWIIIDVNTFQIQEGSTATPYEPYDKYKIPVVQRGINLFDISKTDAKEQTINGITFTPLDDERVHIKGKAIDETKNFSFYYRATKTGNMPIKRGTYKAKPTQWVWAGLTLMFGCNNGSKGQNINSMSSSVSLDMDNGYIGSVYIGLSNDCLKREWDDIIELQLMEGNQNLPYEPYIEPVTTNIFLDEPLRKIGDYADYIDFKENKVVRKIDKHLVVNESTAFWNTNIDKEDTVSIYREGWLGSAYPYLPNGQILSSFFPYYHWNGVGNNVDAVWSAGASAGFKINTNLIDGYDYTWSKTKKMQTFLQWAESIGLDWYLIRNKPLEEPLNIDLPKLKAKTSIIEVDTSLAPSNAYGKYIKK